MMVSLRIRAEQHSRCVVRNTGCVILLICAACRVARHILGYWGLIMVTAPFQGWERRALKHGRYTRLNGNYHRTDDGRRPGGSWGNSH